MQHGKLGTVIIAKEIEVGRFYEKRKNHIAASNKYKKILEKKYDDSLMQEALYRMTVSYYAMGLKHVALFLL